MSADNLQAKYLALVQSGASPQAVYSAAKGDGLSRLQVLRTLRGLYECSLDEAVAIVQSVEGPVRPKLPDLQSYEQLLDVLRSELGWCNCAPPDALDLLRRFLEAVQQRSDAVGDREAFQAASRAVEACLPLETAPGMASWFVYTLEHRDFIWHGWRMTDAWITDKGRWLLDALNRHQPLAEAPADD